MSDKDNAENYTERALKNFQCSIFFPNNDFQSSFYFIYLFLLISYFTWVSIQVLSPVLPWSPGPECTKQFDCRDGFSLLICSERHGTYAMESSYSGFNQYLRTEFRILENGNWLNLNKRPCWDSICDPLRPRQTHKPLD